MNPEDTPQTVPDPNERPTVEIAGKHYPLRYRHRDVVFLRKTHQVDMMVKVDGAEALERLPIIVWGGLQHLGDQKPKFEDVQNQIGDADIGECAIYSLAVMKAQKKASAAAEAATSEVLAMVRALQAVPLTTSVQ